MVLVTYNQSLGLYVCKDIIEIAVEALAYTSG